MGAGLTRREFIRGGVGVASFAVLSGLRLAEPRKAHAVAGIDDVTLGALVLLVATLGGYAVSKSVANVSLQALGYGFSDFVSDAGNQAAAVTQTLADANNLSVELNRSNAEQAAASIAAGTGYFAEVMADAATSGRVALDNFISGVGELPGVLRNLVGGFLEPSVGNPYSVLLDNATSSDLVDSSYSYGDLSVAGNKLLVSSLSGIEGPTGVSDIDATWCIRWVSSFANNGKVSDIVYVYGSYPITFVTGDSGRRLSVNSVNGSSGERFRIIRCKTNGTVNTDQMGTSVSLGVTSSTFVNEFLFSGSLVGSGGALPLVDRAADAPDVIGPGYDSLPLGNDLVIDPSTNDVVSAGSLPLPTGIPDVFGDFVGTLNDALAGVVPGVIGLPVSVSEPVVVGTAEGVESMPISDAIATETSLAASLAPPAPTPPPGTVDPPTTVPEGPWTPAVTLPFAQLWPFNMIYSFVQLFEDLGA